MLIRKTIPTNDGKSKKLLPKYPYVITKILISIDSDDDFTIDNEISNSEEDVNEDHGTTIKGKQRH